MPRIAHVLTGARSSHSSSRDRAALEPLDPRPERQLGARGDLGVEAGDVGDDAERGRARGARREVLAIDPPSQHGLPRERGHRAASPSSRSTSTQSRHSPSRRPWRRWTPTSSKPAARCTARLAALEVKIRDVSL